MNLKQRNINKNIYRREGGANMKHILQFSADNEDVICGGRAMCQYPGARCLPISNLSVFKLASDTSSVSTVMPGHWETWLLSREMDGS